MANLEKDFESESDLGKDFEGEPGHPGSDPYKDAHAPQPEHLASSPLGTPADAVRSFANTMTFGAAPELEGAMGALASTATYPLEHHDRPQSNEELLNAYRAVRDEGKKQHDAADSTALGKVGSAIGVLAPHPLLPTPSPGASIPKRIGLGAVVGAGIGGISGAANSPGSLTSDTPGDTKRMLLDTGAGMFGGGVTGGLMAGGAAAAQNPVRQLAEAQALKAAGLRGGIKNAPKAMGLDTEEEALQLGRRFLDEGLIPVAGSTASVAKEAEKLQGKAGNAIGATLTQADTSGKPFDYDAFSNAALEPYNNATAVAKMSGGKSLDLADALAAQGKQTPGSFTGANAAKSDAWKSANFNDDAPMAAKLYRQATGSATGNIEDQVRGALGPDAAAGLSKANERYGVASDALKLAREAGRRNLANSSMGLREQLMLAAGMGGTAGGAAGHTVGGVATGLGAAALANWGKKHGNALTARTADFLANRLAENSGGHAGGLAGQSLVNRLEPWEEFLKKDEEKP